MDASAHKEPLRPFLSAVFTVIIGVMVYFFVYLGVQAFYPAPAMPQYGGQQFMAPYPAMPAGAPEPYDAATAAQQQAQYQKENDTYSAQLSVHDRNAAVAILIAGIIIIALSLAFLSRLAPMGDGVLLGGVFILWYATTQASSFPYIGLSQSYGPVSAKVQFVIGTISLITLLVATYFRFGKPRDARG